MKPFPPNPPAILGPRFNKCWGVRGEWLHSPLLLLTLVFLIHFPALHAYFEADDYVWLLHAAPHDARQALTGSWGLGTAYRPITRLSFLLDARAFGWTAWPWHAENLILHAANATLLSRLARQAGARAAPALLAGAAFAAMPLDWENVDWISGRTGLLCLFFLLAATLTWRRALQTDTHTWRALAPSCACLALSMLCYEPAFILPLALLTASPLIPAPKRRIGASLAALAITAACVWLLRWALLGTPSIAIDVASTQALPNLAWDALRLAAHAWRDFGWAGFLILAALLASGLAARASRRAVACLLLAAVALYLPFAPVAGLTERFLYLATAPLALALVHAAWPRAWGRAALCLLIPLCALRSHSEARGFRHAGDLTRAMLAGIAAQPRDGSNLVFFGVPTHDGPYYLLWANFEDAAAAIRPGPGFAATVEWVRRNPPLLRRAQTQPTRFLAYDAATGGFSDMGHQAIK